jgi:hypothetical protein
MLKIVTACDMQLVTCAVSMLPVFNMESAGERCRLRQGLQAVGPA